MPGLHFHIDSACSRVCIQQPSQSTGPQLLLNALTAPHSLRKGGIKLKGFLIGFKRVLPVLGHFTGITETRPPAGGIGKMVNRSREGYVGMIIFSEPDEYFPP